MKFFEKIDLSKTLLPLSEFKLFCDMDPGTRIPEEKKNKILADAETMLSEPIPQLLASCYARFVRDGNRSEYEGYQFRRRIMLKTLTQAELIENQGRFLDKIIDLVWLIAEETTWVIPAHNYGLYDKPASNLLARDVEDQVHVIDLFSSETGAVMALTRYLLGEKLDAIYPKITRRMDYVIEKHILVPFERELFRWAGYGPNGFLNNWNPWVIANILMVTAVEVEDMGRRLNLTDRALFMLDKFVDTYPLDGGCDEGPSYWTAAAAALYDCLEILYDMTGGQENFLTHELNYNMCDYIRKAFISGDYVMNFADAPAKMKIGYDLLYRMGRRTGNPALSEFASYIATRDEWRLESQGISFFYRSLRNQYEVTPAYTGGGVATHAQFPGISVVMVREGEDYDHGFYFAMKGGHNAESHNHNDVGNFVVYRDGAPVIIDIGVGTYSKKTFSDQRYTIPAMTSPYHNVPEIGGIAQGVGAEFKSENTVYHPDNRGMSVDIHGAYPKDAGIIFLNRSGRLDEGCVTVTDSIRLEGEKEVVFRMIAFEKPDIQGNTVKLGTTTLTVEGGLQVDAEYYEFDDVRFNNTWNRDGVWRINLSATLAEGLFRYTFR